MVKLAAESKKVLIFFSFLGIFVSCLGLLGLAIFMAEQKRKEICIRKAFGSGAWQVGRLFITRFTNLVLWPLIAIPLSYGHEPGVDFTQKTFLSHPLSLSSLFNSDSDLPATQGNSHKSADY
jgi:hypothetical protein